MLTIGASFLGFFAYKNLNQIIGALEKEVEALRLKLGSRRKESVDSLYSSSDFKTKAADDVRRILESD